MDASGVDEYCVTMVMPFLLNDVQRLRYTQGDPELLMGHHVLLNPLMQIELFFSLYIMVFKCLTAIREEG